MLHQLLILPIVFAASVLAGGPIRLPSEFKRCSMSDPALNECLMPAIQDAIATLVPGSRPLGVLPIDPLKISSLGIHQPPGSPVAINLDFSDLSIRGIRHIVVKNVDAQLNGDVKNLTITVFSDHELNLEGKYTIDGKVLVLPIVGNGNAKIDFIGVDATISFSGKTVKKGGHEYLGFTNVALNLDPRNMRINFENLFNGDKALGDNMNKFLNDNWREVVGELKPPINKALAHTFINIANLIFTKVPISGILNE